MRPEDGGPASWAAADYKTDFINITITIGVYNRPGWETGQVGSDRITQQLEFPISTFIASVATLVADRVGGCDIGLKIPARVAILVGYDAAAGHAGHKQRIDGQLAVGYLAKVIDKRFHTRSSIG